MIPEAYTHYIALCTCTFCVGPYRALRIAIYVASLRVYERLLFSEYY